jgi:hypothetical protein
LWFPKTLTHFAISTQRKAEGIMFEWSICPSPYTFLPLYFSITFSHLDVYSCIYQKLVELMERTVGVT